ncbi:tRNA N(3)-methylcytidine methyltransferase METTL6 [Venturia canescens]|uniref:tRNA N(3)-methylcytidine methyltransferase METTL6 n=1 Tax=Venturia canescens TaxID=32260 RepID=UPI001C9BEE25|nr:tRNA N(3)-methylcytidine methyltransferase METTL6 [Venturia canescens]
MENAQELEIEYPGHVAKRLTSQEIDKMRAQDSRLVTEFRACQIEKESRKNWDLFYKRNDTRFFKDRHWTTREFRELLELGTSNEEKVMMEVGCGVGNLIYPLLEDGLKYKKIYACDLSPRAIDFVKSNPLYDADLIKAFHNDVTNENCFDEVEDPVDLVTLVFVLSAIHPDKFKSVALNIFKIMNKDGTLLFRDYGLYDMAQLRFKPGHKIAENFYMRQDGTRSYYFSVDKVKEIFESVGFETLSCSYVERRTVNVKENVDVQRIFVQARFKKS